MTKENSQKDGLKIGDKAADGWIYGGISKDSGQPMWVAPADEGVMDWEAANNRIPGGNVRLPSRGELRQIFKNAASIGGFNQASGSPTSQYWSSDPVPDGDEIAYIQSFFSGGQRRNWKDIGESASVRYVRN